MRDHTLATIMRSCLVHTGDGSTYGFCILFAFILHYWFAYILSFLCRLVFVCISILHFFCVDFFLSGLNSLNIVSNLHWGDWGSLKLLSSQSRGSIKGQLARCTGSFFDGPLSLQKSGSLAPWQPWAGGVQPCKKSCSSANRCLWKLIAVAAVRQSMSHQWLPLLIILHCQPIPIV